MMTFRIVFSHRMGVYKRALVGSLNKSNHPYILTLEPSNEKQPSQDDHFLLVLVAAGGWAIKPEATAA